MAKRKRPPGEGSVYFDKARGAWVAARTVGYTQAGNPRRISARGRTQGEARRKLDKKLRELGPALARGGLLPGAGAVTVGEWLDRWLTYKLEVAGRRIGTVEAYRGVVERHIKPAVGGVRIGALRPTHVERLLDDARARGLGPRMVRYVWSTINNALRHAVRAEVVATNVCDRVEPPRTPQAKARAWDAAEARRFLEVAGERSRLWCLFEVALATGMRRGELLALDWSDVDLDAAELRVDRSQDFKGRVAGVKTDAGHRTLPLAAGTVDALERWRDELVESSRMAREAGVWRESGRVWPSTAGTPLGARNMIREFKRVVELAGCSELPFHGLRHTAATLMLRAGVPIHVVSHRLGHRDPAITLRVYAHVLRDMRQGGALELDQLLGDVQPPPPQPEGDDLDDAVN